MKYAYYPGCSLHSTGAEYDQSLRLVARALDVEFVVPSGWVCCGTSGVHIMRREESVALALANLNLVYEAGFAEVVVPCAACFNRFRKAQHDCLNDPDLAARAWIAARSPRGASALEEVLQVKVLHPLELFMQDRHWDALPQLAEERLEGVKVACYYGCLLTRPPAAMQFDVCEYPVSMDRLLEHVGIATIEWSYKTDCCGGSLMLNTPELVLGLVRDIFANADALGANLISVACPLCHANLDMRQDQVNKAFDCSFNLPIVYFTQLLGLTFGLSPKKLGLSKHFVDPRPVLGGLATGTRSIAARERLRRG